MRSCLIHPLQVRLYRVQLLHATSKTVYTIEFHKHLQRVTLQQYPDLYAGIMISQPTPLQSTLVLLYISWISGVRLDRCTSTLVIICSIA